MALPYQEFPPDLRRLTPRTTALTASGSAASSIQGINTRDLPDGAVCFAQDVGFDYRFRRESTTAPATDQIIEPSAGPGRWFQEQPGGGPSGFEAPIDSIVAVSASRLVDLDATAFPDGAFVYVRATVHDLFDLNKTSARTVDGIEVVDAIGGGQWLRRNLPWLGWLYQDEWWIDAATGDDENDGLTALTALATHAELTRRIGDGMPKVTVTVHIVGDVDAIAIPKQQLGITYVGEDMTPLAAGVLTAATTTDGPNNIQQTVTSAGLGAFVGKRIRLTANDACANILADLGANEVRTTHFLTYGAFAASTLYTPAGTEAFVVEDLPATTVIEGEALLGFIIVDNLRGSVLLGTGINSTRCELSTVRSRGEIVMAGLFGEFGVSLLGERIALVGGGSIGATTAGCRHVNIDKTSIGAVGAAFVVEGAAFVIDTGVICEARTGWLAAFDAFASGVVVRPGGLLWTFQQVYGAGNTDFGIDVLIGGTVIYMNFQPTIVGGSGDTQVHNTAYAYAQIPVSTSWGGIMLGSGGIGDNPVERVQYGTGTLLNGSVTVGGVGGTIYLTTNSKVELTPIGGAGLTVGELTVDGAGDASPPVLGGPGVAAFTVRSLSAAGALVDDDRAFNFTIYN